MSLMFLSPAVCPGYSLLPAGKADNLSDSSHSEISSRSSICSVDSVPAPGPEERCISSNRTCAATAAAITATAASTMAAAVVESTAATHAHLNADYHQPSTRYFSSVQFIQAVCSNYTTYLDEGYFIQHLNTFYFVQIAYHYWAPTNMRFLEPIFGRKKIPIYWISYMWFSNTSDKDM